MKVLPTLFQLGRLAPLAIALAYCPKAVAQSGSAADTPPPQKKGQNFPPAPQFRVKSPLLDAIGASTPALLPTAETEKKAEEKEKAETPTPAAAPTPAPTPAKESPPAPKAEQPKPKTEPAPKAEPKVEAAPKPEPKAKPKVEEAPPEKPAMRVPEEPRPVMAAKPEAPAKVTAPAPAPSEPRDGTLLPAPESKAVKLMPPEGALPPELENIPAAEPFVITRNTQLVASLSGITLFADDRKNINDTPKNQPVATGSGIQLLGLQTPEPQKLKDTLRSKYLGRSLTFATLDELVKDIIEHYSAEGRPTTHVYIPEQEINGNKIRIAVLEGRVGQVKLASDKSSRWYKTSAIENSLQLEPGAILDKEDISNSVYRLNLSPWARLGREDAHPFRQASVSLTPGAELGLTDLELNVRDRMPVQFFAGYDNTGTALLGENRFNVGGVWFDALGLGLDHQMAIQFQSDVDWELFHAGVFSYQIPIRKWNQYMQFFAAYMDSSVELPAGGGVNQVLDGSTWLAGLRYTFGLPAWYISQAAKLAQNKKHQLALYHEVGLGFDFKSSDSNLAFGGTNVFAGQNEVAQFVFEYNARQTDRLGETTLQLQTYWSPGELTNNNSDQAFLAARSGGTSKYIYTRASLARTIQLPLDMIFQVRGTGQWSNENLIASEQLGLGGYDSVRGYSERLTRGDTGFYLQAELYSPPLHPLDALAKKWPDRWSGQGSDELRFLVFFDYGYGDVVNQTAAEPGDLSLSSFGFGMRYRFNKLMTLRMDYGIQLEKQDPAKVFLPSDVTYSLGSDSYLHLGLSLSF